MSRTHTQHAHNAVIALWGRAKEHLCVDCFSPAYDWSLNTNLTEDVKFTTRGKPYSDDPEAYEPRGTDAGTMIKCFTCRKKAPPLCQVSECRQQAAQHIHKESGALWVCKDHELVYGEKPK